MDIGADLWHMNSFGGGVEPAYPGQRIPAGKPPLLQNQEFIYVDGEAAGVLCTEKRRSQSPWQD